MRVATDVEKKAYQILLKQAPPQPTRRMDDKLWRNHLFHPACRNSIADIMSVLYRGAPELFAEQQRALLLKKKEKVDPEHKRGRGGLRYFEVYLQLAAVMATGDLDHYHRPGTAAAPRLYPGNPGALVVGTQHEVFRDVSSRQIRWMLGRELTCARPEFAMVRAVMPEEIAAALEAAVRLYSRTGSGANLPIDPRLVEAWMRELSRTLSERAVKALRAPVAACIERQDLRRLKDYLEGIEHTASRAGLLMAGDVTIADRGLSEPDAIVDMSYRKRARELMLFTLSEDFFVLREQLELKISSG
jgi:hypothetical protein